MDAGNPFTRFVSGLFGIGRDPNLGGAERTIRLLTGAGLLVGAIVAFSGMFALGTGVAVVSLVVGLWLLYEAQAQYCPLNTALDRSTYDGEGGTD